MPAPKKKQILFVDDFNRAEIGPAWKRGEGERGKQQCEGVSAGHGCNDEAPRTRGT